MSTLKEFMLLLLRLSLNLLKQGRASLKFTKSEEENKKKFRSNKPLYRKSKINSNH
jgi:hypothetical protein